MGGTGHYQPFPWEEGNFVGSYLLNEMSNRAQFGLILKSRDSSLKWAQVEVCSSIRLGAVVFQSKCNFQNNGKNSYNFERIYFLNELSNWAQFGLILKSKDSSLKWAQVEVSSSIRLGAVVFQSWCNLHNNGKNPYNFERIYFPNEMSNWAQFGLILKSKDSSFFNEPKLRSVSQFA